MTLWRLILRSLWHYRRSGVMVALGAAIAVAAIVGSLLVGDSARGSLRDLALERLGATRWALTSRWPLRQALAARLSDEDALPTSGEGGAVVPALVLEAVAFGADDVVVPSVAVIGVEDAFASLYGGALAEDLAGPGVLINRSAAEALGVAAGDQVILRVPRVGGAGGLSIFGRRSRDATTQDVRVTVARVISDEGPGRFTLRSDRPRPGNVFVPLAWLQRRLGVEGKVNTLLLTADPTGAGDDLERAEELLAERLAASLTLEDYRLRLVISDRFGYVSLESADMVLPPHAVRAAHRAAEAAGLAASDVSAYLANSLARKSGPRIGWGLFDQPDTTEGVEEVPYSTIAAIDLAASAPFAALESATDTPLPQTLEPHEIILDQWTAERLAVDVGEKIVMRYYHLRDDGTLADDGRREFALRGIAVMGGPAVDGGLVPEYEGLTDATDMKSWDPPFPVDLDRIGEADEAYWADYGAAPKAFIAPETARRLWRPAGPAARIDDLPWLTSVRVADADNPADLAAVRDRFAAALAGELDPSDAGLAFRPVRAMALRASGGSTDFGMLFLSMSFFLVIAAMLLVALLVRLSIEQRARQMGILAATGVDLRTVARSIVGESALLSAIGALVGLPLGVVYARAIIAALRTWWVGALGPFTLELHVTALSPAVGAAVGWLVAVAAAWWAARLVRRTPTLTLLGGWRALGRGVSLRWHRAWMYLMSGSLVAVFAIWVLHDLYQMLDATTAFFIIGPLMLLLCFSVAVVMGVPGPVGGSHSSSVTGLGSLARASAARQPIRSMATLGLVALATFMIVAVAVNRVDVRSTPGGALPGSGGYDLVARSDMALRASPATAEGRETLRFDEGAERLLADQTVIPLRISQGDDASCLNLQQPMAPRVVGVPDQLRERGEEFEGRLPRPVVYRVPVAPRDRSENVPADSVWAQLDRRLDDGTVPALADASSAQWILHAGLGDVITVPGARGEVRLRLVGLLKGTIFQGELLVSESAFLEHFGAEGYRGLLVDVRSEDDVAEVAAALRRNLGELGFDVRRTADVLADFAGVQNAYLSTFHTLGGLALGLGVFAVVIVLLRNVVERRGELGMLLALGFNRRDVTRLVVRENMTLVVAGLAAGGLSGLTGLLPQSGSGSVSAPWLSLVLTLAGVAAVGYVACRAAAGRVVGDDLLGAIRSE